MVYLDLLGRKIGIGDIVSIGDYSNNIAIAKVTSFSKNNNVVLRTYMSNSYHDRAYKPSMKHLREEPSGYIKWTHYPERKIVILKKA